MTRDSSSKALSSTVIRLFDDKRFAATRVARRLWCALLFLAVVGGLASACLPRIPGVGIGGHYNDGKEQFMLGKAGNMDTAIERLDSVVREEPTYKDSLTLLGRAYYNKGNYEIARQILQRALLVNKEDEIAWLTLGLAQLQLGEDERGIETLQGAITLISKVSRSGYRNFRYWDGKGLVRTYIARAVVEVRKGPEAKASLIRTCETLLSRMDDEENYQRQTEGFLKRYEPLY